MAARVFDFIAAIGLFDLGRIGGREWFAGIPHRIGRQWKGMGVLHHPSPP